MSTVVLENKASIAAEIISVLSGRSNCRASEGTSRSKSPYQFRGYFRLELSDLDDSEIESGRVVVRATVDNNAIMVVTLFGESDSEGFHT